MSIWILLSAWIGVHTLQLVSGLLALHRRSDPQSQRRYAALCLSGLASILPLATLLLFVRVFVIGGSSNVAQMAGDEGLDLWRLWLNAWPILFFGNPVAGLASLVAIAMPPYAVREWPSMVSRGCAIVAAMFGCYIVLNYFPDA